MVAVRQVGETVALLGECPVWSETESVLYWEDIEGRAIHRWDPATQSSSTRPMPGRPGSFVLTERDGELVVAMEHEIVRLDWATGHITPIVAVEDATIGNRLNDGRCDHHGRFHVGTMWPDGAAGEFRGGFYRIDPDGSVHPQATDVGIPNGLVFDAERSRMYWADTLHKTIWVWDYDVTTGERENQRVFYDYGAAGAVAGLPDGACLDAEGGYWSASVYGWALTRISPDGVVDHQIDIPVQKPSMPAFGGPDLRTLYVTTIGNAGNSPSEPGRDGFEPGALLQIDDVGVAGLPEPRFGG